MRYDIFISYRREGGYDTAKHLNDLLVRDGYKVSFDIDTLRSGDFDTQLLERIDQCKDFILIVDQHAFDRTLNPKFNPKNDWMRCELAYALKKKKNVIPVFLSGVTDFPNDLPNDISGVSMKNGPEFNRYHFNAFYDDLKKRFLKSIPSIFYVKWIVLALFVVGVLLGLWFLTSINKISTTMPQATVDTDSVIYEKKVDISFYGKNNGTGMFYQELFAKVDGFEYKIEIPDDICFMIKAQEDFDGDGVKDALIEHVKACGGNACGNSYFFVSYSGNGYFSISNSFGNNVWENPLIEDWKGQKSVVIIDTNDGNNTDNNYNTKERYVLKQGDAVRVESSKKNSIVALQEIRSSDFHDGKEGKTIRMTFDLDENGITDFFECRYWDRWDLLLFDIILNGNSLGCDNNGVSRVGILSSKTNGVHDLICNENDIVRWNGESYDFDKLVE